MSMAAPRYMSDPEYLKWFDFETDTFRSKWCVRRMRNGRKCVRTR